MRSIVLALAAAGLVASGALAQQPGQAKPAPRDTGMAGMPGMPGMKPAARDTARKRPPRAARDTARKRPPRDTGMTGMPGMRPGAGRDTMRGMAMGPAAGRGMAMMSMSGPLGIPESRDASGTAWQPDVTPMYAVHRRAGPWSLMLHGNVFLEYIGQGSDRGEQQLGSVNWFMGMARRSLGGGDVTLRTMLSLEPLTVGKCGYPDQLATGELCNGRPLHDRQHPHDLFMEVAALYRRALGRELAVELYGGPAGEPALGPVAFPHRLTALWTPSAPISHHWQDATHVAFGVVTAGVYGRRWKLEGSAFNGREPDDNRFDFDLGALDSYSGRLWLVPSERLTLQLSTGYLKAAEQDAAGGRSDVHRSTASLAYQAPLRAAGFWATTVVWGQNRAHGSVSNAELLETSLDLDGRNILFARGELDRKSGEELVLPDPALANRLFGVGKLALGYTRQLRAGRFAPGIGGELSLSWLPSALEPFYGTRVAPGFAVYASLRPRPMGMGGAEAMAPGAR